MTGPELITLGCRLNIAESEAMRQQLAGRNDVVIVNSCAVTAQAVRQTRQAIRRAARRRPDARIVVTGCAVQTDPQMFTAMPEVAQIMGNAEKSTIAAVVASEAAATVADIMNVRDCAPQLLAAFSERVRAFVVVQNGCDHRCTFCVIPFGRGPSRSVPAGAIIDQTRALVDQGVQEIVLTGVDVTSYGPDLPGAPTLGQLVERILKHVPQLRRLRLSSIDGSEMDERLIDLLANHERVMPHVHLSLQAGSDMILKRMKRRHNRAEAVALTNRLRAARPDIAIGADIIAGFPTETDEQFGESVALIRDCGIVHGHIFPYSPRAGTPAARMPQIDSLVIKSRAAQLRAACSDERTRWLQGLVGSTQHVLVETSGLFGHSANFAPVSFHSAHTPGSIVPAVIAGLENDALIAHGPAHG